MLVISLMMAVSAGLAMALQSPTNTALAKQVGSLKATTISFGTGTVALWIMMFLLGKGDLWAMTQTPFWTHLGGAYGVFIVATITLAAPVLGIALTLTVLMFGQLVAGALVDQFGWFGVEPVEVGLLRIAGCLVVAMGIMAVYLGKRDENGNNTRAKRVILLAATAGSLSTIQSPTNAALAKATGDVEASVFSFTSGFILIAILTLLLHRTELGQLGRDEEAKTLGFVPWMFLGGIYGALTVFASVFTTPYLGVTLLVTALMLGQLGGALLVDGFGWMRTQKVPLEKWRIVGVLLIAAGMIMVTIAKMK